MRAGLLSLVLLTMFAGSADAAMVIDTRYQELWARVSTQRWYANPVYQSTRYGQQDQDSVELVRTDERDQRVSADAERNTFVAADSIFLTGSTDMLATHCEPLAGEALCWCLTESWVRNKSEFTFTVDEHRRGLADGRARLIGECRQHIHPLVPNGTRAGATARCPLVAVIGPGWSGDGASHPIINAAVRPLRRNRRPRRRCLDRR